MSLKNRTPCIAQNSKALSFGRQLLLTLLIVFTLDLHANVEVSARFEPARIAVGSTSRYIVEITDSATDAFASMEQITSLPIPSVNGIRLRNGHTSTSQQTSIINGRAEYSITQQLIIDAIPADDGSYTIPSYAFDYNGKRLQVPAATLSVVKRSAASTPTTNEQIFLTLEAPEQLYVGQAEMITLKLYFASDVRLGEYVIERDADGFITSGGPPEEPTENIEIINGRNYRVYSWPLAVTPISAGKQDLNFQSTLIAQLPNRRNVRNSPFGNSIFDDLFSRAERLTVYTEPAQINVLPLPTEGQPENFSGAVGQFNISVGADTQSTRVNEPIMLSLKLSGQGNFDRIREPKLPEAAGWRSYPPESVFEADDANKLKGTKRFDYIFVPEKAGTLKLPEVSFSFFDPDVEKYVELTSPAITIEVAPSNVPIASKPVPSDSAVQNPTSPQADLTKSLSSEELLLTLDYRPEKGRTLPTAGSRLTPSFYWLNGSFLIALSIIGGMGYLRTKNRQDEHYLLLKNAKQELKAALKKANGSNGPEFYTHAQKAVRLAASIRMRQNLQSTDLDELETKFKQLQLPEKITQTTRTLFHTADRLRFSGQGQTIDLSEARAQLKSILKAL